MSESPIGLCGSCDNRDCLIFKAWNQEETSDQFPNIGDCIDYIDGGNPWAEK
jgi:hypothetical protein